MKKYLVTLTDDERRQREQLLGKGKVAARTRRHAHLLRKADPTCGWTNLPIAEAFDVSVRTVERLRQRFVAEGFDAALSPKPVLRLPRKVEGDVEAHLVALACSDPPEGRQRWTLRLLAGRLVELGHVASIAQEGVRPALKKTSGSPGRRSVGASRRTAAASWSVRWRTCGQSTSCPTTPITPRSAWTRPARS